MERLRAFHCSIFTGGVMTANSSCRTRSPGGAVAQRLRGFESAEPEKTVKRSSRRTGVNLQFFPVQPSSLGLKGASSPFFVAPARRNRWHFSGSLLVSKENIPRQAETFRSTKKRAAARCSSPVKVCALIRSRMQCGGRAARHGCSGCP